MSDNLLECNRLLEAAQKLNQATIAELRAELDHIRAECVENGITPASMTETQAFHGELSVLTNCATDGRNWRAMLAVLVARKEQP